MEGKGQYDEGKVEYDFFVIGQKHASDSIIELKKIANMYEKDFGKEAKEAFELGVVSFFPTYGKFEVSTKLTIKDAEGATFVYGEENKRNNSYFGGTGESNQYVDGVYNEPSSRGR